MMINLPKNIELEEFFIESNGCYYWHSLLKQNDYPISAGFGKNKELSRRIAYSEYLERINFYEISKSDHLRKIWNIDQFPTACGFAHGFDRIETQKIALKEAIERWALSQWIDNSMQIEEIDENKIILSDVSQWFKMQFLDIKLFKKEFIVKINDCFVKIYIGISICMTSKGIFPGSSSSYLDKIDLWDHAFLESYRHFLSVKNNSDLTYFPYNKMKFFSMNKNIALKQIENSINNNWKIPRVKFEKTIRLENTNSYLSRFIINDWNCWSQGPLERFLY